ncbi:ABC transporter ATP-binding protein [Pseudonocardia asaccharolytica]|uniref:Macrolide ABC transporter ATP-binding protein n=1 Tax=Pseudonocardia asaccharolytica DSM 44247 = NBRC 16224 TaxID=1123024 RepID=A0A511D5J0_9PSEU|nr:ABC transporter ATP-binding protein [Pseudonocardia asaccharolytica]GEL19917.1 macrolide ABC transporter ATP-binding protein [Pseudonocardia asaccharolytica DSM 44247 = NBRC 16224]
MAAERAGERPVGTERAGERPVGTELVMLERIGRRYGTDPPVVALRGVDLRVRTGDWLAVVGPSGSGKSTLLNIVGCLDRPDEGSYRFDGLDVTSLSDRGRAGLRSHRFGFVFQSFHLLAHRTVLENVMLAEVYAMRPRTGRRDRALAALAAVGLADRTAHLPTHLSGGERQRAAIARALVNEPALLLCDEPTGNLDSRTTAAILGLLGDLHDRGLSIIVITHDPGVAERAQRRVRIVDGELRGDG